jgi:hypothetical protein
VALVTTLLVEYLAKPRLEVRKERILEKSRERRKGINDFRRALNLANKLLAYKGQPPLAFSLMDEQIKRSTTDLQDRMFTAAEFIDVPQSISREWEYTISAIHARSVVPSAMWQNMPDDFWEVFEDAFQRMKDFRKLFKLSKLHPLRRRKLIRKIAAAPAPSTFISAKERDSLAG